MDKEHLSWTESNGSHSFSPPPPPPHTHLDRMTIVYSDNCSTPRGSPFFSGPLKLSLFLPCFPIPLSACLLREGGDNGSWVRGNLGQCPLLLPLLSSLKPFNQGASTPTGRTPFPPQTVISHIVLSPPPLALFLSKQQPGLLYPLWGVRWRCFFFGGGRSGIWRIARKSF